MSESTPSAGQRPVRVPDGPGGGAGGGGRVAGGGSSNNNNTVNNGREQTLADALRAPSATVPEVVVLNSLPDVEPQRDHRVDPREDLWLSTADGRYNSRVIPLNVGKSPTMETFYVHKNILVKCEVFAKALNGNFKESVTQVIDLPEEDPAIFHFLVTFLYENRYEPIRVAATMLSPDQWNAKGKNGSSATTGAADEDSDDSVGSYASDVSARSRRLRERRQRREERITQRVREKHLGVHRPNCNCPQCVMATGAPCWNCAAPRIPQIPLPLPMAPLNFGPYMFDPFANQRDAFPRRRRRVPPPPPPAAPLYQQGQNQVPGRAQAAPAPGVAPAAAAAARLEGTRTVAPPRESGNERMSAEDMRTWLLAYELHIDVYIMANKFLLEPFKQAVLNVVVDMLETAGTEAATHEVLLLCEKLYHGLNETDPLLKKVFARMGFLQPWKTSDAAANFLVNNPQIVTLILFEMAARRDEDFLPASATLGMTSAASRAGAATGPPLPSMERGPAVGGVISFGGGYVAVPNRHGGWAQRLPRAI